MGGLRLIIWDKVKLPLCHYRVIHRKRVTCELHDSYFRFLTIKHSISKIQWVIVWAWNYYITQLSSSPSGRDRGRGFRVAASWRRDMVGKATSGRAGLLALMSWGPEKMLIRCHIESQHPVERTPRPQVEPLGEQERDNVTAIRSGGQNIEVYVRSPTPSHTQTLNNPFEPLQ